MGNDFNKGKPGQQPNQQNPRGPQQGNQPHQGGTGQQKGGQKDWNPQGQGGFGGKKEKDDQR